MTRRDVDQGFARCVRAAETDEEPVIIRDGRPVARLVPVAGEAALSPIGAGRLDRAALHER